VYPPVGESIRVRLNALRARGSRCYENKAQRNECDESSGGHGELQARLPLRGREFRGYRERQIVLQLERTGQHERFCTTAVASHWQIVPSKFEGAPMRDGNILRRHLRPAAIKLGIDPKKATWRSLRTSCATWMIEAGANPKDTQAQMRHERLSTTTDIYAQHVPTSQRRAVTKTMVMVRSRQVQKHVPLTFQNSTVFDDVMIKTTELSN
jgi:hypothetical protein